MAKQQKKSTARRTPRASAPRMYGDGKPSQVAGEQSEPVAEQQAAPRTAPARPVAALNRTPATRTTAARAAGATPRGAGAAGSFGRVDRITDYGYVLHDMRRLGITAAGILAALVVLGIIIH